MSDGDFQFLCSYIGCTETGAQENHQSREVEYGVEKWPPNGPAFVLPMY